MSRTPTSRVLESLAAGWAAGALGGLLYLAVGLVRRGGDVVDYWPTAGLSASILVRSAGLYALLFGVVGVAAGAGLHLLTAGRGRRSVFALVAAAATAFTVLAYLTAWWQTEVLAGLPMGDPARWHGALWHAAIALAAGAAVGGVGLRLARRRGAGAQPRNAAATMAAAILLVVAGEAGIARTGSAGQVPAAGRPRQVVVVGLDGMTLRVLSPLLRAGELQTLRRLMAEGAWGTIMTYGTASSPRVWTSMATGKRVRDHGIDDFVKAAGDRYRAVPMTSSDRKARALWNILSDRGRHVAVINWLITHPPEEVDGYVLARLELDAGGGARPPELAADLAELWGTERPKPAADPRRRAFADVDRVFDTAARLLARERFDFLALYAHAIDGVQHLYWRDWQPEAFDPELWPKDAERAGDLATLLPDLYRHVDRRLGELLAKLGDDALVIVVSDHGQLAAAAPRVQLRVDAILARLGYAHLLPNGSHADYAASSAYALVATPWTPHRRVNLNVAGREPRGIVEPAAAAALTERLVADLEAVRFADGGPLFTAVERRRRPAAAGPGADLRLALSRRARLAAPPERRIRLADEELPLRDFQEVKLISGDHDHQGVLFVRGPGVVPGMIGPRAVPTALHDVLWHLTDKIDAADRLLPPLRRLGLLERATTLDLAPTVLYALGLPVGRDMAGRPLTELFSRPAEVEWVATYETLGGKRLAGEEAPSDEEYLEKLRALGYVD